ncbi:hypothetical protein KP509_21G041900 [Ceratopteris richardii]|uniref:DUF4743 domain-containing protein n=1 Tax=Ceratopteris richardii TaxID=49495 RepID=A0A8T2S9N8_CERRI|nr:hypothetical protein KP509_21G041900 [Ceratopteris richardii]KAH7315268.1 hypothetical protein KP509_21G041900 [Ceratopteris richardii]
MMSSPSSLDVLLQVTLIGMSVSTSAYGLRLPALLTGNSRSRDSVSKNVCASMSMYSSSGASFSSDLTPYINHVKRCNRGKEERKSFVPFLVDNVKVGFIHPSFMQHLIPFSDVFAVTKGKRDDADSYALSDTVVTLHHDLKSEADRTSSVNRCLKTLNEKGIIPGWRDEMYPVVNSFGASPFFSLERAAVPYFGTKSVGLSVRENVIKECEEEASICQEIAERALPVSAVSYEDIDSSRFKRDVLFCYDLELPLDFKPFNQDGEVDSFMVLPVEEIKQILESTESYKPNCALVVIDFLIRHGYIAPDQPGYLELLSSLRQGECS